MADAPTAGFHHGVPFDEYRSWPAISQSDLKVIHAQSPAHWRHQQTHRKTSAAMNLGSLVDCLLLEPQTFGERFVMAPTGPDGQTLAKRSAAAKAEWAEVEASGKIVVTSGDMEKAEAIKRSVLSHEIAAQIVRAKGKRQLSLLWTDPSDRAVAQGANRPASRRDRRVRHARTDGGGSQGDPLWQGPPRAVRALRR